MGLLTTSAKYGTLAYLAHKGLQSYEKRRDEKRQEQQQQQQQQQQQPQYPLPANSQPMGPQQMTGALPPQQQQYGPQRDAQGTFHQVWCKGNCGGQCVSAETWRSLGVEAGPAPPYEGKAPAHDGKAPVY